MKANWIKRLFGEKEEDPVKLLAVTPPRKGKRTMVGVENMLGTLALPEPFSLEIVGDVDGVTLMARCRSRSMVKQQLEAIYPQALINEVPRSEDPLRLDEGEQAWSTTLGIEGPEYVPLRVFGDDDLVVQESDPLIPLIGSMAELQQGERLVAKLHLTSLGHDWAQAHQSKLYNGQQHHYSAESPQTQDAKRHSSEGVRFIILGIGAMALLRGYFWVRQGETWKAILLGAGIVAGGILAGWAWHRWRKSRNRPYDPILIKDKLSRLAFSAHLEVTAILSEHGTEERAKALLDTVTAAYRHYDNAAGAQFKPGKVKEVVQIVDGLHHPPRGLFSSRNVLGVREVATLWHPPGEGYDMPLVARSGARALMPAAKGTKQGALVGESTARRGREVRFPDDLLKRHHLYVARTRMGKSTLMHHVIVHKMRERAAGRSKDAIVVVDPHADLVGSLLGHVPSELVDKVQLIDLADDERIPGINLLDTRVFGDRDRTADSVVRVARGLWDQWGPRMQSILEHMVKTLHEANESMDPEEQYTILDGLKMLANAPFRSDVLQKINDHYILEWWASTFSGWSRDYKADSLAPVQTRLSYYASSKRARAILGQSRSTIDIRKTIREGGVLLVSTSQATAGRDVAALVGASLLNLVDSVIREQGSLSLGKRRGVLVVVDEMQSMPGVDYESMLSELGKFGASFILATQSLSRLQDLSPTLQDSLLANLGCLAVFQMAASDARQLVWELDRDRVSEEDVTSLPVHHCYVRATVGKERMPTFSMAVRKPEEGDPAIAAKVREAVKEYTVSAQTIVDKEAEAARLTAEYKKELEELKAKKKESKNGKKPKGRRQRKRKRSGEAGQPLNTDGSE